MHLHLPQLFSNLTHLHLPPLQPRQSQITGTLHLPSIYNSTTPTSSTMEDGHARWREIHSPSGWTRCIHDHQLDPWLKQEIIRCGVFTHAAKLAFKFDSSPESYPNHLDLLFQQLHHRYGYQKTGWIHSQIDWSSSIVKSLSKLFGKLAGKQEKESNLIGYVAVSNDDMSHQIGRRNIVVAWRGTVKLGEWLKDLRIKLKKTGTDNVRVADGFNSIYRFKSTESSKSASEEVMGEVTRLVQLYRDRREEVGLTITGHSLGGALALLNAYEAASSFPDLPISVISFGAPQVGNISFRDELSRMENVKILRVVNELDIVPSFPGLPSSEGLTLMGKISGLENLFYKHVDQELILYAEVRFTILETLHAHRLKTYLSLLSGSDNVGFQIPCECSPRCYVGK